MVGGGIEVVGAVLEVADVAWTALEHHKHIYETNHCANSAQPTEDEILKENQRLRSLLEENIKLLQELRRSLSHDGSKDVPPDLFQRLVNTVESSSFRDQLNSIHQTLMHTHNDFAPKKVEGEYLVSVDPEKPSWVWIMDERSPSSMEELSGIDNESYVIVSEDDIVDGIANFMAQCIILNPRSQRMTPEELQKTVAGAFGWMNSAEKMLKIWHAGKIMYTLSTWGLAMAGLYRHRAVLKIAAQGIHASSKVILKAL
ncbi:uncharacterized protein LOC18425356 isoform X2 [Amborella trichopoda]|uniref:Uncharacterized protein n=1 Tax=Amborella trichopoda TaxID=13333 RepID=W1NNR3_AMBTC|nr:uncharacterized protein LOC18425356 isoform X2 [Amborella trichopoda]ERM97388.1 hypothetical protein AMTR_s00127p00057200 [Amborella trichopoda]|eukprot:XP_006829972.1 uncharacterized protein LOC18425356 isoform X2 [Amborella trichopoda]